MTSFQIKLIAVACGVISTMVLIGCGGFLVWFVFSDFNAPSAHGTAHEITLAVASDDFDRLCDLYSEDSKDDAMAAVGADDCDEYVAVQESRIRTDGVDMKVLKVEQHGDRATVTYSVRSGLIEETNELTLVREHGEWKMDMLPDFDPRDRPSRSELVALLVQEVGVSHVEASCIADDLLDSDLTDTELEAILLDDQTQLTDDDIDKITSAVEEAVSACIGADVSG